MVPGRGDNVHIAVLDSGIQMSHEAFANSNLVVPDLYASPDEIKDQHGHGTAMSGIIAGNPNGQGIYGMAPQAQISVFHVLTAEGLSDITRLKQVLAYILDYEAEYDIVNMSFNILKQEYDEVAEILEDLYERGIVLTAAAGNDKFLSVRTYYPARSEHILAVGAVSDNYLDFFNDNDFHNRVDFIFRNEAVSTPSIKMSDSKKMKGCSVYAAVLNGLIASILSDEDILRTERNTTIRNKLSALAFDFNTTDNLETLTLYKT